MILRKKRIEKGLTQTKLAKSCGFTRQRITNYEAGIREPNIQALKKLAKALECTVDELIEDDDDDREISAMPEAAAELSQ